MPKDLPHTRIEYDLNDEQKATFDALERIGEERSETLHYEPARLTVIEHVRFKYAAKKAGESTIVTASAQPSPLPKSNASAGLLANILVNTYVDHLPLNRQEMRYARHGVYLPRSTLCEWKLAAAQLLEVLLPPLRAHQLQAPRMHVDDTTLPLLEKGRTSTRTARLWGYLGAGQREENGVWVDYPAAVVFEFAESRSGSHPLRYLQNYKGYLQADAYSGHQALYETGDIVEVGCWAHYLEPNFISRDSDCGLYTRSKSEVRPPHKVRPRSQGLQEREEIRVGPPWLCVQWLYAGLLPERSHGIDLHLQVDRDVPPRRCDAGMAKVVTDHGYVRSGLKQGHGTAMSLISLGR